jgi:hypothetical protein
MATPAPVDALTATQVLIQLIPVIAGGVIGVTGSVGVTLIGSLLKARDEKRALSRTKLETIVTHLAEVEHWASRIRHRYMYDEGEDLFEPDPCARIAALTTIYFAALNDLATQLGYAADKYELALMEVRQKILTAAAKAMEQAKKEATAADPHDPLIAEKMNLAATEAKISTGSAEMAAVTTSYKSVLVARRDLLAKVKALAIAL